MIRKNSCGNITDEEFLNIIIPFDKKMDKYGTLYMSIFAEKINNNTVKNKFAYADLIIKDLIMTLGADYHYTSLPIKNQILYCPEL